MPPDDMHTSALLPTERQITTARQALPELATAPLADASANLILGVLQQLHLEQTRGRQVMPLAALCKRLDVRLSTLQRHLTALVAQDIIRLDNIQARQVAALTENGRAICLALED